MRTSERFIVLLSLSFILLGCAKDSAFNEPVGDQPITGPRPYFLQIPEGFGDYYLDEENRLSYEGIELGRRLFYDPILSRERNVSCGSCHQQQYAFSDHLKRSIGTHGGETSFHSMPLFNIAWMNQFFWDGRAFTREDQAILPVVNAIEMDMTWKEAVARLQADPDYPELFRAAFGTSKIDSTLVSKAIVQFEMTIVSADSKYDRWLRGEAEFTSQEELGYSIFIDLKGGDCIHCHMISNENLADNAFHNNGLDNEMNMKPGLSAVSGRAEDCGKFKTPSLRNLAFTAPYMHDGRFQTLEDVIRFYSFQVHDYGCVDPLMEYKQFGGVALDSNEGEFKAIIAFLKTLTDSGLVTNPAYSDPFKP